MYFIKKDFEKITIVGEDSSIATTIEFVIITNIVRDKVNGGPVMRFLSGSNNSIKLSPGDSLNFTR